MLMRHTCPECGATLPDDSPTAPCAACLMKLGMQTWQEGGGSERENLPTQMYEPSQSTPSVEELETYFPQLEIIGLIGQGGMGAVFQARQKSLDRTVALKLIRADSTADEGFAERFVREAKALAQLSHPNIVTVHDFGQTDQFYFFIMEYVDGTNLRQLLRTHKINPETALTIVPRVCDALQYAHDNGIVHRDIKPENILVDKSGNVKIADFGLAKLVNKDGTQPALTQTHQVMGTMHYMAPEQIERPLTVDHRADIYSLGVVIYEMLTGELPLGRFAPPSKKVQIDVRLDEIVLQSLEKEPELRFQQISQVKSQVESLSSVPPRVVETEERAAPRATQRRESPLPSVPPVEASLTGRAGKPQAVVSPREKRTFFGVIAEPRSWTNILYLLLSFPLGLIYFVLLVVGFSAGIPLIIVWVGLFVLLGTMLAVRGCMMFERQLTRTMLGAAIASQPRLDQPEGIWERIKLLFTDSTTWTGIGYLFLKFPLGIISFTAVIVALTVPLSLMATLFIYDIPWLRTDSGLGEIDTRLEAVAATIFGFFLFFAGLHLLNGLAWVHKTLAVHLLNRR